MDCPIDFRKILLKSMSEHLYFENFMQIFCFENGDSFDLKGAIDWEKRPEIVNEWKCESDIAIYILECAGCDFF